MNNYRNTSCNLVILIAVGNGLMLDAVLLAICGRIRILIATNAPGLNDRDTGIKSRCCKEEGMGSRRCTGERGTRKQIYRACAQTFPYRNFYFERERINCSFSNESDSVRFRPDSLHIKQDFPDIFDKTFFFKLIFAK